MTDRQLALAVAMAVVVAAAIVQCQHKPKDTFTDRYRPVVSGFSNTWPLFGQSANLEDHRTIVLGRVVETTYQKVSQRRQKASAKRTTKGVKK